MIGQSQEVNNAHLLAPPQPKRLSALQGRNVRRRDYPPGEGEDGCCCCCWNAVMVVASRKWRPHVWGNDVLNLPACGDAGYWLLVAAPRPKNPRKIIQNHPKSPSPSSVGLPSFPPARPTTDTRPLPVQGEANGGRRDCHGAWENAPGDGSCRGLTLRRRGQGAVRG